jgi:hypothetical protein
MSKHLFERLVQGYKGEKQSVSIKCKLEFCDNPATKYKGRGENLCEQHQAMLREYGGPARIDRPWTFQKKRYCEKCGHNPWDHPMVKSIDDELIRDRIAYGMLLVDHITAQRDGGQHHAENTQTLCFDCNHVKTTLAGDSLPKALYSDPAAVNKIKKKLSPYFQKLFG